MSTLERNLAFAKLPPNLKRVEIAKDVLAQIETGKLKPDNGLHLWFKRPHGLADHLLPDEMPLESVWEKIQDDNETCHVCAKGAVFVSACLYKSIQADLFTSGWDFENENICTSLEGIFSRDDLDLIERLYEGWEVEIDGRRASFSSSVGMTARLRRIMQAVVDGNGDLDPTKVLNGTLTPHDYEDRFFST